MRRIKVDHWPADGAGSAPYVTMDLRDYRLMRAVVRAAESADRRSFKNKYDNVDLHFKIKAFNAPEKRK